MPAIGSADAPYDLVKTMRASVLVLGPLLVRAGAVRVSLPGGCAIGVRPIDLHLKAFEKLGAEVRLDHGYVEAKAGRLTGAEIVFDTVTVTGTENVMLAAMLARGTTRLVNAAREPEVTNLAVMLVAMGAQITGAGGETIVIEGVESLHGVEHPIIPDRIEAGTYVLAAAATRGDVVVRGCAPEHLTALTARLAVTGARLDTIGDTVRVRADGRLVSHDVATAPYPGFPTDLQAQWMALATAMDGRRDDHRDDLREPLPARRRARAHGRPDPSRGPLGGRRGTVAPDRRHRHGERPAGLGRPRHRRADGRGRNHDRPGLPPRPGLREDGGEARGAGRQRAEGEVTDCLFCKIAAGEIPSKKVFGDDRVYAFHDIAPKAPTHVLVIPRKHIGRLADGRSGRRGS